ncbi:MAG: asparagine synthase (glutamine-hydrolyzing), partial [Elusimicrobiota bacterium]|nr:asparagine synthase (glutamine-hydrolyzing) [Elusimicrobiota bacterium]
ARDRLGIKPLFYTILSDRNIVFASEIRSILFHQKVTKEINLKAIDKYFTFLYVPSPETIYKDIYQLPQAHYLLYKNGQINLNRYWNLQLKDEKLKTKTEKIYLEELEELLKKVIAQHLISDVPLGIFLSGGRDSSTITAFAAELTTKLNTFTIGYLPIDASYNEFNKAEIVAKCLNTNHKEFIISVKSAELLNEIATGFSQPFADSSAIPTYLVSKTTRANSTAALTGIGGDELFCGYPRYLGMKLAQLLPPLNIPQKLIHLLPESYTADNPLGRIKRFLYGLKFSTVDKYISFVSYLTCEDKLKFYSDDLRMYLTKSVLNTVSEDALVFSRREFFKLASMQGSISLLDQILFVDLNTYLCDDLLSMADRMSMLNSLELRVPFCDHRVVEFVASIPASLRLKGITLKYLLRQLLSKYLPKEIVNQKKMGFMVPLARWLRDEFKSQVVEFIRKREYGDYFQYGFIERMWLDHISGKENFSDQLWALLVFDKWCKIYQIQLPKLKEIRKLIPKRKLKILTVSDIIFEDEEGGSGRMVSEISNELSVRGHKVVNFTRCKPGYLSEEKIALRDVYRYRFIPGNFIKSVFVSTKDAKQIISKLTAIDLDTGSTTSLHELQFDIVNYHHPQSAILVDVIRELKSIPKVYCFHSPWHREYEIRAKKSGRRGITASFIKFNSAVRKRIERRIISSCQKVILLSEYTKNLLKEYHKITDDKIVMISGAVDTEKFKPAEDKNSVRQELGLKLNKIILLTVRNLVPRMGLENLIIAFRQVLKVNKNIELIIVGQGYLESKLKNLTNQLQLNEFVKFTGFVPDELLPKYYQSADLFILPTYDLEGFGLVTIEALSCGLPVLGTPIGGTVEILSKLSERINLLFDSNTPEAMSTKINQFIQLPKEQLVELLKRCRQFVLDNFTWKKVVDKIEEVFYTVSRPSFF